MFRIIFVIDILDGIVVHAIKGERQNYKPINDSKICTSLNPIEIVSEILPCEIYIADLNKIMGSGNNFESIKNISKITKTMADIGVMDIVDVEKGIEIAHTVIIGTETSSFELIEKASEKYPISVSIDIKNGEVLTKDEFMEKNPYKFIKILNKYNLKDVIILNLKKVGTSEGIEPEFLKEMVSLSSHSVLVGGGIKDMNDIEMLKKIGIRGALVATALHNGKISLKEINLYNHSY